MRRLKKKIYLGLCATTFAALTVVRYTTHVAQPATAPAAPSAPLVPSASPDSPITKSLNHQITKSLNPPITKSLNHQITKSPNPPITKSLNHQLTKSLNPHPIRGVHDYKACFPDVQDVQIVAARRWGVSPVADRRQAEERKSELVFVGSSPYVVMDRAMSHSIPYLVPRAADLLTQIGRNFLDSLYLKGVPFHQVIVTSVLRTEGDLARLRQRNGNASEQSCHRFATTFDIAYNRYHTVCPPGEQRREVRNDTLKWVLCEVLRDLRAEGRCYIKYEVKQGCFHITTR